MSSFCGSDNDENDYEVGYREGVAACLGLVLMADAIRKNSGCCIRCGFNGREKHPNKDYDHTMYWDCAGQFFCGPCADKEHILEVGQEDRMAKATPEGT